MTTRWQVALLFLSGFLADWFTVATIKATTERNALLLAVISAVWAFASIVPSGFVYDQPTIAGRLRLGTALALGSAAGALTAFHLM